MQQIHSKQDVIATLKASGVTPTRQRVEIGYFLLSKPQHISADQVLAQVNVDYPAVSKATVYNTLNLFAGKGLIREVIVDPSKVFYDSNTTPHHHFFNVDTGELSDVPPDMLSLVGTPVPPDSCSVLGIDVIVRIHGCRGRN